MRGTSRRVSRRKLWFTSAVGAVAALALAGTAWSGEEGEAIKKDEVFKATAVVQGLGAQTIVSFDISFVDPTIHTYLLADRTNKAVQVVDTNTDTVTFTIKPIGADAFAGNIACATPPPAGANDCKGPNAPITTHDTGSTQVWVTDGPTTALGTGGSGVSKVKVFNGLSSNTPFKTISTGGARRADEGCFDSKDHILLIANDAEVPWPFISFIASGGFSPAAKRYTVIGTITMDGTVPKPQGGLAAPPATNGIEQCQWDEETGKFYLNIPEVNGPGDDTAPGATLVIDPTTMQIEKIWSINHDDCAGPQGMAIGPSNQILLGCNAPSGNGKFSTVIINKNNGSKTKAVITKVLNNESGADEVWFNPDDGHYFLGRSGANVNGFQQLGVVDSKGKRADQSIPTSTAGATQINAHSPAAIDHKVYFPIPGANAANPNGTSTICGDVIGGTPAQQLAANQQGCIPIFTAKEEHHGNGNGNDQGEDNDNQGNDNRE